MHPLRDTATAMVVPEKTRKQKPSDKGRCKVQEFKGKHYVYEVRFFWNTEEK